ncbi:MAG: DUF2490 domain-containing protein [Acidobacteria bacterium]|nr:DUF2490 domain-containing protein [Acidobacteriota bacterium]
MRFTVVVMLLVVVAAGRLAAQVDDNAHAWFNYFGDHPISAKSRWGVHLEGQWRRADLGLKWQQLVLRPGVNFQAHRRVMLTGGYAFVDTFRYGDFPARARFGEHRIYEQTQITQRAFKLDWQHRLRLEQRHIRGFAARYESRFRYMLRVNVPLRRGWYVGLYDEYFHNFGREVAANKFDQNRAYVAVGHPIGRDTRLEVGFMEQTLQQRSGRYEHNHTLMVSVFSRLPWGK